MNISMTNAASLYASVRSAGSRPPVALRPPTAMGTPVAARVQATPEFDSNSVPTPAGQLSMYTRAADRVEAAIQSRIGQSVDVRA